MHETFDLTRLLNNAISFTDTFRTKGAVRSVHCGLFIMAMNMEQLKISIFIPAAITTRNDMVNFD